MSKQETWTRRKFLAASTAALLVAGTKLRGAEDAGPEKDGASALPARKQPEPVIDIHQHTNYGRSDDDLVFHQRAMGVTQTVLLPAGSRLGLAAGCGGNDTVSRLGRKYPGEFLFFANELPNLDTTREEIEKYLKRGAIGIGEQKFDVRCDSQAIETIATVAKEHGVPVLLHFQHGAYNTGLERFHKILETFPRVDFIGHAQTWWGNIDLHHKQEEMYPKGKVTRGGITDRLLAEYPNMYGDLSAGSGLNALLRDEDHTRGFFERHQDKLLFGTDCADRVGRGKECQGAQTLAAVRRLCPSDEVRRKILYENAKRLLNFV